MLLYIALGVGSGALLLNIVGLAITKWILITKSGSEFTLNVGLWKVCVSELVCEDLDEATFLRYPLDPAGVDATRAMEVLAAMTLIGALTSIALKLFVMKERNILPTIAGIGAIVAGVLGIIGCILYGCTVKPYYQSISGRNPDLTLHAGFTLCIVSGIGSIATGALAWYESRSQ